MGSTGGKSVEHFLHQDPESHDVSLHTLERENHVPLNVYSKWLLGAIISFYLISVSFHSGTYHCIFRYKNSYSIATKDVTVYPLPLQPNIMLDPLEASVSCGSSHSARCCVEDDEDYIVTFHMGPLSFPAGKMPTSGLLEYTNYFTHAQSKSILTNYGL